MELQEILATILDSKKAAEILLDGSNEPFRVLFDKDRHLCLSKKQQAKLKAVLKLCAMLDESADGEMVHIGCPQEAAEYLLPKMRFLSHEEFRVLTLNSKNRLTGDYLVSTGTLTTSVVHAREVYSKAIVNKAAAIMVVHNHPSGDSHPSQQDDKVTEMLSKAGKDLMLPMLDHIIIGNGNYYSYAEANNL